MPAVEMKRAPAASVREEDHIRSTSVDVLAVASATVS
jgi:hypothetical protein